MCIRTGGNYSLTRGREPRQTLRWGETILSGSLEVIAHE
jgi:hypothetical protein